MDVVSELSRAQSYLTQEIKKTFEEIAKKYREEGESTPATPREFETIYPVGAEPAIFKGTTPTCVLFGTQRTVAHTWKNVFKLLILKCNEEADKHKKLMELRNKVLGRERILLSDGPGGMRRPFQIDKKLYAETHYDTGTLIRILLHRLLDEVGFDYSNISVGVKN